MESVDTLLANKGKRHPFQRNNLLFLLLLIALVRDLCFEAVSQPESFQHDAYLTVTRELHHIRPDCFLNTPICLVFQFLFTPWSK